ncbi:hypothetical protein RFI_09383 [Reticulomyxa filosa]|uniref:Uncharacterized protein n=1 Tax=Reticulomyxa filosa TaxID=46433 RepID=X6NN91_RETFI|nr:hypothetical protein RFI_09383 [Reticulomyxa filosa]|eukprot:ETO27750.1 hypothetical protein RFI_09383 [Reticulomyxa filosa]
MRKRAVEKAKEKELLAKMASKSNDKSKQTEKFIELCKQVNIDHHFTNWEVNKKNSGSDSAVATEIETTVWDELEFEDVVSQPLAEYRWGTDDEVYDIAVVEPISLSPNKYLMVSDKVIKGPEFKEPPSGDYAEQTAVVLRVEQWDKTRVNPSQIRGDRVYTQWSLRHGFRFDYNGASDVAFFKRGHLLNHEWTRIRVGDRVQTLFGKEDDNTSLGTVAVIQFTIGISGVLAKVQWDKNDHVNMYSWGFGNVYDIAKVEED